MGYPRFIDSRSPPSIRALTPDDAAAFRELRLRALATDPEAFGSSVEDEESIPLEETAARIGNPDSLVLGAFDPGLVGMIGLIRERPRKLRHRARIWGTFVVPESRGRGIAGGLLDEAIQRARALQGVERVDLGVATTNERASKLYESRGFRTFGVEPDALRVDGRSLDEALMVLRIGP